MRIHREGTWVIPISILILAGIWAGAYALSPILAYVLTLPGIVMAGIIIWFFRHPIRDIPQNPKHILSPCDGKVVVIEEVEDKAYFGKKVRQFSIYMSPLNVHVNRHPIGGEVKEVRYFPGKYLMAFNPKSSTDNEQNYVVTANEHMAIAYKQIAGFLARRIRCYVTAGEAATQGHEYGFIRFGSRVDVLIPLEADITVELGQKVAGGLTVLAKMP